MSEQSKAIYGGQAVIEGVMFQGRHVNVTAVRRKNNEISYYEVPREEKKWLNALKKIPLVRGLVGIIEASARGAQHLNYAAEKYAEDEEGPVQESDKKSGWSLSMILGVAVVGVLSFIFGKVIFTAAPAVIEQLLFGKAFENQVVHTIIEGIIKIVILIVYLWVISMTPIIKRLFQYHGAEHKVITAYEAGLELTVKNVQKFNTLHYRCGSSFIVLTVIIGVIIYSFVSYDSLMERVLWRLALLPLVIGVSYEFLRFTNALRDVPVLRFLGYPGLWLQLLTTKEPSDDQVEVSIASFNRMLEMDKQLQPNGATKAS
ncbi:DUF1385 domain-containing protein [Paenibacillus sp. UMB4589-SE434]|uniref:DUF1385 domain-containing protein n=1 Tax=Paenibacillus sp. UMB4589-SE434 TaxID=3046314 RepID=UPI00254ECC0C|nr:DUF1385 domain-containing protein [Paenibacillus sp. UMB4589-SE434]MDK8179321.1 DUF1385 domain-containing protein [Paenibacillus sp. UMB4589-SE434]